MGVDQPDFWQSSVVNIITQDLAEIINRPKYGGAITGSYYASVTASSVNTLISVSAKGMIYGGFILSEGSDVQGNDYPYIEIDGERLSYHTFDEMKKWGYLKPHAVVPFLLCFDETNYYYSVGFCYGYTFETGFKVYYEETHGRTPTVTADLYYATI